MKTTEFGEREAREKTQFYLGLLRVSMALAIRLLQVKPVHAQTPDGSGKFAQTKSTNLCCLPLAKLAEYDQVY